MSDYRLTLNLQGARIEVKFESAADLERKLDEMDLARVARVIDDAMTRLPHPPGREGVFHPPSSRT